MIEIKNLSVNYGDTKVYNNFNLKIESGKITTILGESGSGKTTLMRAILNLIKYSGEIKGVPEKKSVVFQEDRLLPNLTVRENLTIINPEREVNEVIKSVGLTDKTDLYIKELSGGMKRRVAFARAVAYKSPLYILDEPFTSVDLAVKIKLIKYLKKIQEEDKATVISVTHDYIEALELADRIIVISKGEIVYDDEKDNATEKKLRSVLLSIGEE